MRPDLAGLAGRVAALAPAGLRSMVAVAGPPGAGKSTLAGALVAALGPRAVAVPMDGFHLDNAVLEGRGLLARKGAPESFDGQGFVHAMRRLAAEPEVVLPGFERAADFAIAGRIVVGPAQSIAVVEGNYLLFDEPPWRGLGAIWDLSVFLAPPREVLRARLVDRWRAHGLGEADAVARAEGNDLANADRVLGARLPASLVLEG